MADINFGEELQKPVNIAGHKVPLWVIGGGAAAVVAAFVLLKGGGTASTVSTATPADSATSVTPSGTVPGDSTPAVDPSASIQDASAQLQGLLSGYQSQLDALNQQNAQRIAGQTADLQTFTAPTQTAFVADNASQAATLRAEPTPAFQSPPPATAARNVQTQEIPYYQYQAQQVKSVLAAINPNAKELSSPLLNQYPAQADRALANAAPDVYTVKSGDTLSAIARRNGITVGSILSLNPSITNPNMIRTGQQLRLFVG